MEANRRKVLDRAEAMDLLEEWKQSGLALADFSRSCGVDGRSLNCWRLNLARSQRPVPARPLRLVELDLPRRRASYRIRVREFEVEVDDDFDPSNLAQLLDVVRGC